MMGVMTGVYGLAPDLVAAEELLADRAIVEWIARNGYGVRSINDARQNVVAWMPGSVGSLREAVAARILAETAAKIAATSIAGNA